MLYTLIPEELIFASTHEYKRETIEITGGLLEVEINDQQEYRVVRLISSDPSLYLEEKYAPRALIQLLPKFPS